MHYNVLVHDAERGLGLQLYEIELFCKFHTQERKCTSLKGLSNNVSKIYTHCQTQGLLPHKNGMACL